jgi:hypothetical protein
MHALVRRGGQVVEGQLPLLRRLAATAAAEAKVVNTNKPVLEKEFLVYRWDPEREGAPEYKTYKVDLNS